MRKQPKPESTSVVQSAVEHDHYRVKNWVAQEWLPIIGVHGMAIYDVLSSSANREHGNSWFFSLNTLSEYMQISRQTIILYSWLLEACDLIHVTSGDETHANVYTILEPSHVTAEALDKLRTTLSLETEVGQSWREFKQATLKRIDKWKKLRDCWNKNPFRVAAAPQENLSDLQTELPLPQAAPPPTSVPKPPKPAAKKSSKPPTNDAAEGVHNVNGVFSEDFKQVGIAEGSAKWKELMAKPLEAETVRVGVDWFVNLNGSSHKLDNPTGSVIQFWLEGTPLPNVGAGAKAPVQSKLNPQIQTIFKNIANNKKGEVA